MIKRSAGDPLWFITADNTQAQSDANIKRLMGLIIATAQQQSFTQLTVIMLYLSHTHHAYFIHKTDGRIYPYDSHVHSSLTLPC